MFIIERDYRFEAARVLPKLPDDHPCSRLHGHAFGVTLVVKGELDKEKEWVVDYYETVSYTHLTLPTILLV